MDCRYMKLCAKIIRHFNMTPISKEYYLVQAITNYIYIYNDPTHHPYQNIISHENIPTIFKFNNNICLDIVLLAHQSRLTSLNLYNK